MDQSQLSAFWQRVRRNLTFRIATLYAGVSWFMVEAADTLGADAPFRRQFALVLGVGFLIVIPLVIYLDRRVARRLPGDDLPGDDALAGATPKSAGRRLTPRRWGVAVAGLVMVSAGMWGYGTGLGAEGVKPSAARMAVLPFHASGSAEVQQFGVGMVDLLTTALSDVGGITTISSRTVLARVGRTDPSAISLEQMLEFGRGLGAGSVLSGGVTAFGTNVRLTATVHEVGTAEVLARAEVDGPQDSILALTDRLAVALLREMWRSRAPVPTVRTAALTTTSPAALREYLKGEEHLRALRDTEAVEAFRAALELDSTFALAWTRLATATGWELTGSAQTEYMREYAGRAVALSGRLPERERRFARAQLLMVQGSFEAFDSLAAYVVQYPDDAMGWYQLGDARYHAGYLGLFGPEEVVEPFLKATELDPSLAIGLDHALDAALDMGDRPLFDSMMTRYAAVAPAARVENRRYQAVMRWAPPDSALATFGKVARGYRAVEDRAFMGSLVGTLARRARLDAAVDPTIHPAAMDSLVAIHGRDEYWRSRALLLKAVSLGGLGRWEAHEAALEAALVQARPVSRANRRVYAALLGHLPRERVLQDVRTLEAAVAEEPVRANLVIAFHLTGGDRAAAARHTLFTGMLPGERAMDEDAVAEALRAVFDLLAGNEGGLRRTDAAIRRLGYEDANYLGVPWPLLATAMSESPEFRQRGIRMLRWQVMANFDYPVASWLALGRALEAERDPSGAREAYAHVIRLWEGSGAYRAAEVQEARQALARLSTDR